MSSVFRVFFFLSSAFSLFLFHKHQLAIGKGAENTHLLSDNTPSLNVILYVYIHTYILVYMFSLNCETDAIDGRRLICSFAPLFLLFFSALS